MYCENGTILKDSHFTHKDNYLKYQQWKKFVVLWLAHSSHTLINHVKVPLSNTWVLYNPFTKRQYKAIMLHEGTDSTATTGYTCHSWHSKLDFFLQKLIVSMDIVWHVRLNTNLITMYVVTTQCIKLNNSQQLDCNANVSGAIT